MTFIMIMILVVTIISSFGVGNDLLSPSRIYICVYSLLLSVCYLELSKIQTAWSISTIVLFYGASFSFLIGGYWIWLIGRIKNPHWKLQFSNIRDAIQLDSKSIDWIWFRRVFFVSFFIFFLSFLISMVIVGGLPAFMHDPDNARIRFFGATLLTNYGIFMGPISLMLGLELFWFSNLATGLRRKILVIMILILGMYLTIVTRYDLFRFVIFALVLFHYGKNRLKLSHIFGGFLLTVTLFLIGFLVRIKTDGISTFNELIKVRMPAHLAWASNIYAYVANDFWNFDFAIKRFVEGDREYPLQFGFSLFRALLMNLRLESPLIEWYRFDSMFNESATKVKGLNTVIYVWHFYKDFGFIGAILLPMFAGIFIWKFYLNCLLYPTLFRISIWGILASAIALSYHAPLWELWFFYLNILVVLIAHKKIKLA